MPSSVHWSEFHLLLVKDSSFCDILMVKFEANNELAVLTRLNGWQQQTLGSQTQCTSVLDIRHTAISSEQDSWAGILQLKLHVLSSCMVTGHRKGTCGHPESQQKLLHLKWNSISQESDWTLNFAEWPGLVVFSCFQEWINIEKEVCTNCYRIFIFVYQIM